MVEYPRRLVLKAISVELFPGWLTSTAGARSWDALPPRARDYLAALERLTGKNIWLVSTGPGREDTIQVRDPFVALPGRES